MFFIKNPDSCIEHGHEDEYFNRLVCRNSNNENIYIRLNKHTDNTNNYRKCNKFKKLFK